MSDTAAVAVSGDTIDEAMKPIVKVVQELVRAWNAGDAPGFAAQFGEQADLIHLLGGHLSGRGAIEQAHRALFEGTYAGSQIAYTVVKLKPITPNVLVVFLRQKLTFKEGGKTHEIQGSPTLTLRRAEDGWKIAVFQNTRVLGAPADDGEEAAPAEKPKAKKADKPDKTAKA